MHYGLQPAPDHVLGGALRDLGFDMFRCTASQAPAVQALGARPLALVFDASEIGPHLAGVDVEFGNEPDGRINADDWRRVGLWSEHQRRVTPEDYAGAVPVFVEACRAAGALPWVGAIANTNATGLAWLREMLTVDEVDPAVGVTVHRYAPPEARSWAHPHPGFSSRIHEIATLRAIVGPRRWGVSEFGYHTAPQLVWKRLPIWFPGNAWAWTDAQVAENVSADWTFWWQQGADFAALYQINDGPENVPEQRFGVRRYNPVDPFDWKPVAYANEFTWRQGQQTW